MCTLCFLNKKKYRSVIISIKFVVDEISERIQHICELQKKCIWKSLLKNVVPRMPLREMLWDLANINVRGN